MTSMMIPRTTSIPTIMALRLHLSMMEPVKGDRNMVINMEMEDIRPIRVLEPVWS